MLDKPEGGNLDPDLLLKAQEVLKLLGSGQRRIVLTGPAGTGKTSLIRHVLQSVQGRVHVVAYTGQAARMLQRRGIPATTIHRLIYLPDDSRRAQIDAITDEIRKAEGNPAQVGKLERELDRLLDPGFVLNEESELVGAALCIVDEVSMVGTELGDDLQSFDTPMLVVGDPYQLKPVEDEPFFDLSQPDVVLTKILRQDAGSRIIKLATAIRNGRLKKYPTIRNDSAVSIHQDRQINNDVRLSMLLGADKVICSRNETRRGINRRLLKRLGHPEKRYPNGEWDEELICLRNDHDLGLLNGMPIEVRNVVDDGHPNYLRAEVLADDGGDTKVSRGVCKIYRGHFDHSFDGMKWDEAKKLAARQIASSKERLVECDWGYCITTHKAQGSEWAKVLFISESWPSDKEERRRLHYTAVTRASERIDIIEDWGLRGRIAGRTKR